MEWFEEPLIADELAQLAEPPAPPEPGRNLGWSIGLLIGVAIIIAALLVGWL